MVNVDGSLIDEAKVSLGGYIMARVVIPDSMFPELVELYNNEGKIAVYDLLRSQYGMKQPYFVLQRIKSCDKFDYDAETDRFAVKGTSNADDVFIGLDELCSGQIIEKCHDDCISSIDSRKAAMEKLVNELIKDRLLTLSRYITMDSVSRTILIDQTSLSEDGYRIISH